MQPIDKTDVVTVLVMGDVSANHRYSEIIENENPEDIFGCLGNQIEKANISIANLESPLVIQDNNVMIKKCGPCLAGNVKTAQTLAHIGVDCVNLANNHIMDYGVDGIKSTISLCEAAGIQVVGAGRNIKEARKPIIFNVNNCNIGFYCMAESEFSIASKDSYGANGLDAYNWIRDIAELRKLTDALIVLLHTGKEAYELPTPAQQELCRRLVSTGANAVICQHSHCIGAFEEYENGYISYGQGNLLFDTSCASDEMWTSGYAIKLVFQKSRKIQYEHIYYRQKPICPCIVKLGEDDMNTLKKKHNSISSQVSDPLFVIQEWKKVVGISGPSTICNMLGIHGLLRRLVLQLNLLPILFAGFRAACSLNVIRCETHREVLMEYLKTRIGE